VAIANLLAPKESAAVVDDERDKARDRDKDRERRGKDRDREERKERKDRDREERKEKGKKDREEKEKKGRERRDLKDSKEERRPRRASVLESSKSIAQQVKSLGGKERDKIERLVTRDKST
jgi:ATP-dependent RNA helicase DDX46/PRP5